MICGGINVISKQHAVSNYDPTKSPLNILHLHNNLYDRAVKTPFHMWLSLDYRNKCSLGQSEVKQNATTAQKRCSISETPKLAHLYLPYTTKGTVSSIFVRCYGQSNTDSFICRSSLNNRRG
ncbi:hypothetical protein CHS0354_015901 [Potamilus streckersoni]|uniref:Uncharacterized protein n=1 Tax=Potamilus streckersoni TaxID=2493646 RepID=A0AAE0VUV7_9BIVA|nr:hypothetical protein CHS0354_015901 [Potamilus streckersoni]